MNLGTAVGYLELDTSKFRSGLKTAQSQFKGFTDSTNKIDDRFKSLGNSLKTVGSTMTKNVTLPLTALGTVATKSAVDFESAFAGVRKTVDATDTELAKIEKGIKSMAKEMPTAATEIAGVAEAAGQLGIETPNILGFTKTMVMLGDSTNMSADEAATSLARLANITGMSQKDFDKLGSTIVELGNNLATTESEITAMGLRLAGAGAQVGMSEAQILSFAGALSSVGIEAEAGGSAFSKVMIDMQLATEKGGDRLKQFADVAGMTSKEFKKAFQEDASTAIMAFIEGLGTCEERGMSAIGVLDDMEIREVRLRDALLRAAGASDVFNDALKIGTDAWSQNTALTKEAEQRYETLASKMEIMKNKLTDVGIDIGTALMPHLEKLVTKIGEMADWFSNLSEPMQGFVLIVAGIATAIGPVLLIVGNLCIALGGLITFFGAGGAGAGILSAAIGALSGPVGIAIGAITALIAIGVLLYKNWDEIKAKCGEIWSYICDVVSEFVSKSIQWLKDKWEEGKQWLTDCWENVKQSAIDIWNSIGDFFSETIPKWINSIVNWFNELPYEIGFALGTLLGNIVKWGIDTYNYFSTNIPLWIESISNWFKELPGKIWQWLSNCIEKISTWGTNTYNKAKEWITKTINGIGQWFSQLPGKVWQWLSQAIGKVSQFGRDMLQKGKDAASKTVKAIQDGFKNLPSKMLNIGKDVVKGLWNGISNMTSWIKSKISSFIDGIVAGFSGVFGKVSSKVNSGKRSIEIPNTENVDQIDTSTYSKALKARENTINDFASGMRARAYTMYKNSEVNLKLPTIKTEKTNKSNSERPIEVNLNIDKFVNETAQSVDELINEIAFQLKRKALF